MSTVLNPTRDLFAYKDSGSSLGERRSKPRIYLPFPAKVRGIDASGREFEAETVLDNLAANSLYLRIMYPLKERVELDVVFGLSATASGKITSPRVKVRGTVLRTEQKPGGVCGVVVAFRHPKVL